MNFLVVDDNRLLNHFLTTFLRGRGHVAGSLTDPAKAEDWIRLNQPDALILDIGMPKIDGITLLKQLRPEFPDLKIVMFTGLGYDEDAMTKCRQAGADGYVSKGLGPWEIYTQVMKHLGKEVVRS